MIRLDEVTKIFDTATDERVCALEKVNLQVAPNEFCVTVGPSGCGKTTLLRLISGLTMPSIGEVYVGDRQVQEPRKDVGIVFQAPTLVPWRNVLQNVLLPIEILQLPLDQYTSRAKELLSLVGLAGFEMRNPWELSGGMQQRASICRALVFEPSVLLMDEPFGALDAMTREEMGLELQRIWSETRKTVVFVTHSITEAVFLADRVAVLTHRPGTIARIITIDLPRPRTIEMTYGDYFKEVGREIREEINANRPGNAK